MAILKCKMCGGSLEVSGEASVATCEYCGSVQTLPTKNDDVVTNLYNRANNLRLKNEFDKAAQIYEKILNEDNNDSEAHWGLVLCKYGIEYVEDPKTYKRIPTCHRTQYESILTDVDYLAAVSNADTASQGVYKAQAEEISNLQKDILAIVKSEKPFDVFICYKETDANGKRTVDSALANDIYYQLTQEGLKVFYAAITLEDKLGVEYEPYIFAALNSAKVMLVVGTKPEHFDAVWVRNEWSRYLKLMKTDRSKLLIPCYRDMDAYDLPEDFSHLQAQDMSKIGFVNDIVRGIKKVIKTDEPQPAAVHQTIVNEPATGTNTDSLLERVFMFLEDGDWSSANEYCEKVLDIEPKNAQAYLGKLMAELNVKKRDLLSNCNNPFDTNANYQKIVRFGNAELKAELDGYISAINERNENNRLMLAYNNAISAMNAANSESEYKLAAASFKAISNYKDSAELAEKCLEKAEEERKNSIYSTAKAKMDYDNYHIVEEAMHLFKRIPGWQDADECIVTCEKNIEKLKAKEEADRIERERQAELARIAAEKERKQIIKYGKIGAIVLAVVIVFIIILNTLIIPASNYSKGTKFAEKGDYIQAIAVFEELGNYKDAKNKILEANYNNALVLAEKGDYASAAFYYSKAGNYKDAKNKILEANYNNALDLAKKGNYSQAISAFKELGDYKDAKNKILEANYNNALVLAEKGDYASAAICYSKAGSYNDAKEKCFEAWNKTAVRETVSAGWYHTVGLKSDGTVVATEYTGDYDDYVGQCDVSGWTDIVAIAAGKNHTVGLKSDGTVVATKYTGDYDDYYGQCDVSGWTDIVAVSAGNVHTVGLKSDGTVVAVGSNGFGQCDVSGWTDIVAISAGPFYTVGLKSDGTVVAVGENDDGECDVSGWTDIVAVSAGVHHTVGLKSDGTVVAVGYNYYGQCDVSGWTDIVAVAAGYAHTVGLKSDGTVVAAKYTGNYDYYDGQCDVSGWTDIVAVSADEYHTVGIKSDGTVVAVGDNEYGQCDIQDWENIRVSTLK